MQDPDQWDGFAGTGNNGQIDSATTVTIDAIYIDAVVDASLPDQDAVFYIDDVSASDNGPLSVPEPSAITILVCAAAGLGMRGRRPRCC